MATNVRDPRSIITPDAFELSKELLGTPLARPSRRLWAMLIDLVVIGILTAATGSITLILWGAVALFLISMAFRNPGRNLGQVGSLLFRGATGCLGTVILGGVLIGYLVLRSSDDGGDRLADAADFVATDGANADEGGVGLSSLLGGLAGVAELGNAEDADAAVTATVRIFSVLGTAEQGADGSAGQAFNAEAARSVFDELVPDDAPWADERDAVFERALEAAGIDPGDAPEEGAGGGETSAAAAERVEGLSDPAALTLFLELREAAADAPLEGLDAETFTLLQARLAGTVASDSLEALEDELRDARRDVAQAEERAREAEADLASGQGGLRGLLRDIWEQAGSAIGLWSLYFTIALTLTGGQTVGKKMMGLRVLRLDGEPLTWWSSFERAGGYVAGIATGTLGFVQVFWDSNRQCVHDKIVGTVVVVDGAPIEPGAWQEAWAAQSEVE
jgi:uncharacterized RDD family membrane protein YckC